MVFLMNAVLAGGGYPWTVAPLEQRAAYMAVLEAASGSQNIEPFTGLLAQLVDAGLKGGICTRSSAFKLIKDEGNYSAPVSKVG